MRPLFILGNKRSGTSHLTSLLNAHPQIFISSESDVVWLLYQVEHGLPFACYEFDGPIGMQATLAACRHIIERPAAVRQKYFEVQRHLRTHGSSLQAVVDKPHLHWVGDKKPVQAADPKLHNFIRAHMPDAAFIHLVRHPRAVVGSMLAAGRSWAKVDYWRGGAAQILARWVQHEQWAQEASRLGHVIDVRFEDLVADPAVLQRLFGWLDVPPVEAACEPRTDWNDKYAELQINFSTDAKRIMDHYGYI